MSVSTPEEFAANVTRTQYGAAVSGVDAECPSTHESLDGEPQRDYCCHITVLVRATAERDAQVRADAIARLTRDELIALGVEQGWLVEDSDRLDNGWFGQVDGTPVGRPPTKRRRYVTEWQPFYP